MAFEIRIDRLSHTHSLSLEKKAEVAVYHGSLLYPWIFSFKVIDSLDKTSGIMGFEGTCPVFKTVASSMWTAS